MQRLDRVGSRPDDGSVQAVSQSARFALQVESKAGSRVLILRQWINVLRRRAPKRLHLNNIDRFLFDPAVDARNGTGQ